MKILGIIKTWVVAHKVAAIAIGAGAAAVVATSVAVPVAVTNAKVEITWKDDEGKVLKVDKVKKGEMPSFGEENPSKEATAQYNYTFEKWEPQIVEAKGKAEYTAKFSSEIRKYTITWKSEAGEVIETDENVPYGEMPSYDGEDQKKAKTPETTYVWNNWDPQVKPVEGDQVYTAHFDATKTKYTIIWKNWDDSVLTPSETVVVDYDETPEYPDADPTCTEESYLDYSFVGFQEVLPRDEANYTRTFKAKFDVVQTKDTYFNFELIKDNTEYRVKSYNGTPPAKIYFPSVHDGKPVTELESYGFSGKSTVLEVHIPSSIKTIKSGAFQGCPNIQTVDIQGSPLIESYAFAYCYRIKTINVAGGNEYDVQDYAFEYAGSYLDSGITATAKFGEGLVQLKYSAFFYSKVGSVDLPASMELIGEYVFYYCNYLAEVNIPENSKLKTIEGYAFCHCVLLEEFEFQDKLEKIDSNAFTDCDLFTSVVLPDSLTYLGTNSFSSCNALTTVKLGKGLVSSVGFASAFNDSPITAYEVDNDHPYLTVVDGVLFSKDLTQLLCFPKAKNLTSYTIPNSVISVATGAFRGAVYITEVNVPSGVTSIQYGTFQSCANLTTVTFAGNITTVGGYAFGNSGITSISFGTSLSNIESTAFYNCNALTELNIAGENTKYVVTDDVLYQKDNSGHEFKLILVLQKRTATFTIPSTVTNLEENSMAYSNVTTITIPNTVTTLGQRSFAYAKSTTITLGTGVTKIPYQCFTGCVNLASFTIPDSVTEIGSNAFYDCDKLEEIEFPDACKKIANYAFASCDKLASIDLNKVESIDAFAFSNTMELTEITIPSSVSSIEEYAFYNAGKLAEATIKCQTIGRYAFNRCIKLAKVTMSDDVKTIKENAFQYCALLLDVRMSEKLETIEGYAFQGCTALGGKNNLEVELGITLCKTLTLVGPYVFADCNNLHLLKFAGTKEEFITTMSQTNISQYMCTFSATRVNRVTCTDGSGTITAKTTVVWD